MFIKYEYDSVSVVYRKTSHNNLCRVSCAHPRCETTSNKTRRSIVYSRRRPPASRPPADTTTRPQRVRHYRGDRTAPGRCYCNYNYYCLTDNSAHLWPRADTTKYDARPSRVRENDGLNIGFASYAPPAPQPRIRFKTPAVLGSV